MHCLLCVLAAVSLWRLAQRGYPVTALALLPLAALCCRRLVCQPLVGAVILRERGEWLLQHGGGCRTLCLARSHCVFPWLVYLAWNRSPDAPAASVFLFPDSAGADELRRLRVCLGLAR
ncbi:MAG: protein YgfX [Halieaceae bacterium]|nr:protein YgfX [Halieaceae bacterium]